MPDLREPDGTVVKVDQLVRTPFTAGFQASWVELQLATVHILYGDSAPDDPARIAEIGALARFLADRSRDPLSASPNLVLLGDFNIFDRTDATMTALNEAGWTVPAPIQGLPGGSNVARDKFYDQIAVLPVANRFQPAGPAGVFDFYKSVFRTEDREAYVADMGAAYRTTSKGEPRTETGKAKYYKTYWRTFQMSDHLPMWIDVKIDYSQEYLEGLRTAPAPVVPQDPV